MPASTLDAFSSLEALSPVDGRYRAATAPLRELLSEAGLIGERVRIESRWLLHLSASVAQLAGAALDPAVLARAQQLAHEPDADAAETVKMIEARINHDVKAVEYYVRQQLAAAGATAAAIGRNAIGWTRSHGGRPILSCASSGRSSEKSWFLRISPSSPLPGFACSAASCSARLGHAA